MDNQFNMKKYFSETNLTYLTGAYTRLWKDWHYENITPGYDKFYFVEDGEFALIVNGTYREIRKNQLVLLPCNSTQTYYHFSDALATKYWVHFTMPYRDRDLLELLELPVVTTVDDPTEVTELFRTILGQDQEATLSAPLIQKAALCRLFAYFVDHTQMPDTKEMLNNEKLAEVLAYIDKHLCEPLTVRRLGEVMHLHPNYFIRYFKENTGVSPMRYIQDLRIERAQQLLQTEDLPIQNIATQLGFTSSYYFARVFKQHTGFTPSVYRLISTYKPPSSEEAGKK